MFVRDLVSPAKIASVWTESASNKIAYLGKALFPPKKKMGLDLSWIVGHKGVPVTLKASAFDTVSTIRAREGAIVKKTQMAYFKESMVVKEEDEQEIMRVQESGDKYAISAVANIYKDTNALIDGAEVVPERMIWQLLAPASNGKPAISIAYDNVTYEYDYDPTGEWAQNNYTALTGTNAWDDTEHSNPVADVESIISTATDNGTIPKYMVVNSATMGKLKANKNLKSMVLAQNATANVIMNNERVKALFSSELGVDILVYDKAFKNESEQTLKFLPAGYAVLLPEGDLGNEWYGVTPEERLKMQKPDADVEMIEDRIAVQMSVTTDPVQTKTLVSEICLPSFERMGEVYAIKAF